jgi:hypothetical protein
MATWTCPQDGTENPLTERRCLVCRFPNIPRVVVLQAVATGKEAEFTGAMKLGKAVFKHRFADPDADYASDIQFEVVRDETAVAWVVRPVPGTVNRTCYNGFPVAPEGCPIEEGGVISIGKTKVKLRVGFKRGGEAAT